MENKGIDNNFKYKAVAFPEVKGKEDHSVSITIVNHENSRRFAMSQFLYEELGSPDKLQISTAEDESVLLISRDLRVKDSYKVSTTSKPTIYKASLVGKITSHFDLDFSNRSSIMFSDISFDMDNGVPVAIVVITTDNDDSTD